MSPAQTEPIVESMNESSAPGDPFAPLAAELTIFLEPYPHPTLKEAKPNIFEKVLKMKTLSLFLNKSKPDL